MTDVDSPAEQTYQGFSLGEVTWGYRDIFRKTIEELRDEGWLDAHHRTHVTDTFFSFLKDAAQDDLDHLIKEFLGALTPANRWMLDVPDIFSAIVDQGKRLAEVKYYYGTSYFKALATGNFGTRAPQVRTCIHYVNVTFKSDPALALAFIRGYPRIRSFCRERDIAVFVSEGLRIHARNPQSGVRFMECSLRSSQTILTEIARESRLADCSELLSRLVLSLSGVDADIDSLGSLDSDFLIERGTKMVCMYRWLYVPARIRHFDTARQNKEWHMLQALVFSAGLCTKSFCSIAGHPAFPTCAALAGASILDQNLFTALEYARMCRYIEKNWPGARSLLARGVATEFEQLPPVSGADRLLADLLHGHRRVGFARRVLDSCVTCFDVARRLPDLRDQARGLFSDLGSTIIRAPSFLPDYLYPCEVSAPPSDAMIANLKDQANRDGRFSDELNEDTAKQPSGDTVPDSDETREEEHARPAAAFVYDEWSELDKDYFRDYCFMRECDVPHTPGRSIDIPENAAEVRKVFERIKPRLMKKEKFLSDGNAINHPLLIRYLVSRTREPSPKVNFYETPFIKRRDLTVELLLDVSGSTGSEAGEQKVIDLEKNAALILGQGLAALGDRFSVCGFSSNGREQCEYFVFKDFDDGWDREHMQRIMSAAPRSSTRIGTALRHSGFRLRRHEAKQKLILLITDGKPMDADYDPSSQYAQHDVRMAVIENRRENIHSFCISTKENSRADLEIMFPNNRYIILEDIRQLPKLLPRLYLKLTT